MLKQKDPVRYATAYIDDVVASQVRLGYPVTISEEDYDRAVAGAAEAFADLMRIAERSEVNGNTGMGDPGTSEPRSVALPDID